MFGDRRRHPRNSGLANLALVAALLFPVVYVLSYAPVYRWKFGKSPPAIRIYTPDTPYVVRVGRWEPLPFYRPVNLLIDKTPLREPLYWWAGLFGVREDFEERRTVRLWDQ